jgi:hypothetical protein
VSIPIKLFSAVQETRITLCGEIRRQTTTVARIEVLAAIPLAKDRLRKLMTVSEQTETENMTFLCCDCSGWSGIWVDYLGNLKFVALNDVEIAEAI